MYIFFSFLFSCWYLLHLNENVREYCLMQYCILTVMEIENLHFLKCKIKAFFTFSSFSLPESWQMQHLLLQENWIQLVVIEFLPHLHPAPAIYIFSFSFFFYSFLCGAMDWTEGLVCKRSLIYWATCSNSCRDYYRRHLSYNSSRRLWEGQQWSHHLLGRVYDLRYV